MRGRPIGLAVTVSLAVLALGGCSDWGHDPGPDPYLHQMRSGAPADAKLSDAQLLTRAHDICDHLRPGDAPSWRTAVAYVTAQHVPTDQAWREVDYASTLYCPGTRSSLDHVEYAQHGG